MAQAIQPLGRKLAPVHFPVDPGNGTRHANVVHTEEEGPDAFQQVIENCGHEPFPHIIICTSASHKVGLRDHIIGLD
jgi:hypothetical protein